MKRIETKYFEKMCDYTPKINKGIYPDSEQEIRHNTSRIRNFAREALNSEISSVIAKKEIKNLVELIKELNQDQIPV
jgi:hypothetical protein